MPQQSLNRCVTASLIRVCGAEVVRDVHCEALNGRVTLTGSVTNRDDVSLCGTVARTVPNVLSVDNQISVASHSHPLD